MALSGMDSDLFSKVSDCHGSHPFLHRKFGFASICLPALFTTLVGSLTGFFPRPFACWYQTSIRSAVQVREPLFNALLILPLVSFHFLIQVTFSFRLGLFKRDTSALRDEPFKQSIFV